MSEQGGPSSPLLCCICHDTDFEELGVLACCQHTFCCPCIKRWSEIQNTCPVCKFTFVSIRRVKLDRSQLALRPDDVVDARELPGSELELIAVSPSRPPSYPLRDFGTDALEGWWGAEDYADVEDDLAAYIQMLERSLEDTRRATAGFTGEQPQERQQQQMQQLAALYTEDPGWANGIDETLAEDSEMDDDSAMTVPYVPLSGYPHSLYTVSPTDVTAASSREPSTRVREIRSFPSPRPLSHSYSTSDVALAAQRVFPPSPAVANLANQPPPYIPSPLPSLSAFLNPFTPSAQRLFNEYRGNLAAYTQGSPSGTPQVAAQPSNTVHAAPATPRPAPRYMPAAIVAGAPQQGLHGPQRSLSSPGEVLATVPLPPPGIDNPFSRHLEASARQRQPQQRSYTLNPSSLYSIPRAGLVSSTPQHAAVQPGAAPELAMDGMEDELYTSGVASVPRYTRTDGHTHSRQHSHETVSSSEPPTPQVPAPGQVPHYRTRGIPLSPLRRTYVWRTLTERLLEQAQSQAAGTGANSGQQTLAAAIVPIEQPHAAQRDRPTDTHSDGHVDQHTQTPLGVPGTVPPFRVASHANRQMGSQTEARQTAGRRRMTADTQLFQQLTQLQASLDELTMTLDGRTGGEGVQQGLTPDPHNQPAHVYQQHPVQGSADQRRQHHQHQQQLAAAVMRSNEGQQGHGNTPWGLASISRRAHEGTRGAEEWIPPRDEAEEAALQAAWLAEDAGSAGYLSAEEWEGESQSLLAPQPWVSPRSPSPHTYVVTPDSPSGSSASARSLIADSAHAAAHSLAHSAAALSRAASQQLSSSSPAVFDARSGAVSPTAQAAVDAVLQWQQDRAEAAVEEALGAASVLPRVAELRRLSRGTTRPFQWFSDSDSENMEVVEAVEGVEVVDSDAGLQPLAEPTYVQMLREMFMSGSDDEESGSDDEAPADPVHFPPLTTAHLVHPLEEEGAAEASMPAALGSSYVVPWAAYEVEQLVATGEFGIGQTDRRINTAASAMLHATRVPTRLSMHRPSNVHTDASPPFGIDDLVPEEVRLLEMATQSFRYLCRHQPAWLFTGQYNPEATQQQSTADTGSVLTGSAPPDQPPHVPPFMQPAVALLVHCMRQLSLASPPMTEPEWEEAAARAVRVPPVPAVGPDAYWLEPLAFALQWNSTDSFAAGPPQSPGLSATGSPLNATNSAISPTGRLQALDEDQLASRGPWAVSSLAPGESMAPATPARPSAAVSRGSLSSGAHAHDRAISIPVADVRRVTTQGRSPRAAQQPAGHVAVSGIAARSPGTVGTMRSLQQDSHVSHEQLIRPVDIPHSTTPASAAASRADMVVQGRALPLAVRHARPRSHRAPGRHAMSDSPAVAAGHARPASHSVRGGPSSMLPTTGPLLQEQHALSVGQRPATADGRVANVTTRSSNDPVGNATIRARSDTAASMSSHVANVTNLVTASSPVAAPWRWTAADAESHVANVASSGWQDSGSHALTAHTQLHFPIINHLRDEQVALQQQVQHHVLGADVPEQYLQEPSRGPSESSRAFAGPCSHLPPRSPRAAHVPSSRADVSQSPRALALGICSAALGPSGVASGPRHQRETLQGDETDFPCVISNTAARRDVAGLQLSAGPDGPSGGAGEQPHDNDWHVPAGHPMPPRSLYHIALPATASSTISVSALLAQGQRLSPLDPGLHPEQQRRQTLHGDGIGAHRNDSGAHVSLHQAAAAVAYEHGHRQHAQHEWQGVQRSQSALPFGLWDGRQAAISRAVATLERQQGT